jgi:hypothetical protein
MNGRVILASAAFWVFVLLLTSSLAVAQSGGEYELIWTSLDAGGGSMGAADYSLTSTIGQPEPGGSQSGGAYTLNGGVVDAGFSGQTTAAHQINLPMIKR